MTFEEFCKLVADMAINDEPQHADAGREATLRASEIIDNYECVDAGALFGQAAIDRADYAARMVRDPRLLAGLIAYILPPPHEWFDGFDPPSLTLPCHMAAWFILAIRDPHLALDGRNIIVHGDPNGEGYGEGCPHSCLLRAWSSLDRHAGAE